MSAMRIVAPGIELFKHHERAWSVVIKAGTATHTISGTNAVPSDEQIMEWAKEKGYKAPVVVDAESRRPPLIDAVSEMFEVLRMVESELDDAISRGDLCSDEWSHVMASLRRAIEKAEGTWNE